MTKQVANILIALICAAALPAAVAAPFFAIDEIFSNRDGSVQFLLMNNVDSTALAGIELRTSAPGVSGAERVFTFPHDLPAGAINHSFLVATQGFADLHLIAPDYVVPNGFLPYPSGYVAIGDNVSIYTGLPTDGYHAFWNDPDYDRIDFAPAYAANFAGHTYRFSVEPQPNFAVGGLWWNAPAGSEAGWGIAVDRRGDVVHAVWATYDDDGSALWFVIPRATPARGNDPFDFVPPNTYEGSMYLVSGRPFASSLEAPSAGGARVAIGGFHFDAAGDSLFYYGSNPENGRDTRYKSITHQLFASAAAVCDQDGGSDATSVYQGFWASADASEGMLYLAHQDGIVFALWFTYDVVGKPTWFAAVTYNTAANTYAGALYRTTGPAYQTRTYEPGSVTETEVGTLTLTFVDRANGSFSYAFDGAAQTKSIGRLVFGDPASSSSCLR